MLLPGADYCQQQRESEERILGGGGAQLGRRKVERVIEKRSFVWGKVTAGAAAAAAAPKRTSVSQSLIPLLETDPFVFGVRLLASKS